MLQLSILVFELLLACFQLPADLRQFSLLLMQIALELLEFAFARTELLFDVLYVSIQSESLESVCLTFLGVLLRSLLSLFVKRPDLLL